MVLFIPWRVGADPPRPVVASRLAKLTPYLAAAGAIAARHLKKSRARYFGYHPPMDKEHHPASRKSQRESTPETHHGQSLQAGWQS
jgi:hypothetical protein